ncbi:hypothetical protein O6H91_01G029900 [Diphasiastrum complanatum]|uniref:Uncharacterized protein n=1 Tax=Diphasiastrum complanatum TaxID=34168 RepID=A0ACC2EPG3_DIPCM|nr:hypothetical protein O6H91_Y177900 [Diphasiastrum complanatum]KAJ7568377.1 hypothetical protein O6H91_01G029900 [Diphasiastrum complanatum]
MVASSKQHSMAWSGVIAFLLLVLDWSRRVQGHNEAAGSSNCVSDEHLRLTAEYLPGAITVDAKSSDWNSVQGQTFSLRQAINPDASKPYPSDMTIKVAHDGRDLFFLIEVPGSFVYVEGQPHSSPSVALMFGVGDDATYHNMGGCSGITTCSSATCGGHEVDLMHFSISKAIPGRLYGANPIDIANGTGHDSFGNLNDGYAWNPHCRHYDGLGPNGFQGPGAQNDWRGAWTHSSIKNNYGLVSMDHPYGQLGSAGIYTFELARPLRTTDRLQQDVQFTIGEVHRFAAAFWYPFNNMPWSPSQHYSVNCDWVPLEVVPASVKSSTGFSSQVVFSMSSFALVLALAALLTSVTIFFWVRTSNKLRFASIDTL